MPYFEIILRTSASRNWFSVTVFLALCTVIINDMNIYNSNINKMKEGGLPVLDSFSQNFMNGSYYNFTSRQLTLAR